MHDTALLWIIALVVLIAVLWVSFSNWGGPGSWGSCGNGNGTSRQKICACSINIRQGRCAKTPSLRTNGSAVICKDLKVKGEIVGGSIQSRSDLVARGTLIACQAVVKTSIQSDGDICARRNVNIGKELHVPSDFEILSSVDSVGTAGDPNTVYFRSDDDDVCSGRIQAVTGVTRVVIKAAAIAGTSSPIYAPFLNPVGLQILKPAPAGTAYTIDSIVAFLDFPIGATQISINQPLASLFLALLYKSQGTLGTVNLLASSTLADFITGSQSALRVFAGNFVLQYPVTIPGGASGASVVLAITNNALNTFFNDLVPGNTYPTLVFTIKWTRTPVQVM